MPRRNYNGAQKGMAIRMNIRKIKADGVSEKELLAAKSSMHDNLAACITLTKQYITGEFDGIDADIVCR